MHPLAALWGSQGIFLSGAFLGALSAHPWPGGLLFYCSEEFGWDGRRPCSSLTLITFSSGVSRLGQLLGPLGVEERSDEGCYGWRGVTSRGARSHRCHLHRQQHSCRYPVLSRPQLWTSRDRGKGSRTTRGSSPGGDGERRVCPASYQFVRRAANGAIS
jgi:hypothetical protein